tara:strand:+ start:152 stop:331 length:180 start_codon:yes stop_codon:yes gene_type:complete
MKIKQFKKVTTPAKLMILLEIQAFLKQCDDKDYLDSGDALALLDRIVFILNMKGACDEK